MGRSHDRFNLSRRADNVVVRVTTRRVGALVAVVLLVEEADAGDCR
jgi:hypothetical protein